MDLSYFIMIDLPNPMGETTIYQGSHLRGVQLMQQDLAGVHRLKDGHLLGGIRIRRAISSRFCSLYMLKACVSICV